MPEEHSLEEQHMLRETIFSDLAGEDGLIMPKEETMKNEDEILQVALAQTVWAKGGCNSWYKGQANNERISTLYPFGVARFIAERETVLQNDYHLSKRADVETDNYRNRQLSKQAVIEAKNNK